MAEVEEATRVPRAPAVEEWVVEYTYDGVDWEETAYGRALTDAAGRRRLDEYMAEIAPRHGTWGRLVKLTSEVVVVAPRADGR